MTFHLTLKMTTTQVFETSVTNKVFLNTTLTRMITQDKHLISLGSNNLPKKILHEKLHRAFSEIQSGWTSCDKLVEEGMWPTALAISSVEGPEL